MENGKLVAMSGATGFIGTNMSRKFESKGWKIIHLGKKDFAVPPDHLNARLQGAEVVVNLAGAPLFKRWTKEYKKILVESRVAVTKKLVSAFKLSQKPPGVFISTSAIGRYSSTGAHTEDDYIPADDFLGHLTRDWEQEALRARDLGCRTVIFRLGVVLGKNGGALAKMVTAFKFGLGGTIGDGRQPVSWIHIKDLIRAFEKAINDPTYEGIYNLTAPNPTTNLGLTKALGRALSRPTIFRIPGFVLRLAYGDGAQALTSGQTVFPKRLMDKGFHFEFPTIEEAVANCLKS